MRYDLLIVGGGPAGLATAVWGARAGLSCAVFERRRPPLDKACGEGIMPTGVRLLREMGIQLPDDARRPFYGIRYIDQDVIAEGRFGAHPGWGVRRTALMRALLDRCRQLGVTLHLGAGVTAWRTHASGAELTSSRGTVRGRYLIAADGLHSKIRKQLDLQLDSQGPRRFGIRCHFGRAPWSPFVEVYWGVGVEAYVTPCGPREVGVAFLSDGDGTSYDSLLARFSALEQRLQNAPKTSGIRGAGPFLQRVRRVHSQGVALVGDAAGYVDALTGEGVTLSLKCAQAVVATIASDEPLHEYQHAYRRITENYYRLTPLMVALAQRPQLRRRVVRALASNPEVFSRLLRINAGELPVTGLGANGLWRLLKGLAAAG